VNLSFLNTWFLYFLPLISIPFILHLLFRKKPVRIVFSHLYFLRLASKHTMPRTKLQNWLLLIVRSLIILLLILLFSRPLLHIGGAQDSGDENAFALVLIVDASYSMRSSINGRTVYDRACETAQNIIDSLRPADRAAVLIFSDTLENPSPVLVADKKSLKKLLQESSPGFGNTEFLAGMAKAFEMLSQSAAVNKGIIFLTDSASHGWPEQIDNLSHKITHYNPGIHLVFIDCGYAVDNLYIKNIDLTGSSRGRTASISWHVYNPNESSYSDKDISVMLNDKKIRPEQ